MKKKLILIVEQSLEEQENAKKVAVKHGCLPIVAGNLEDGLRLFKSFKSKLFGVITTLYYEQKFKSPRYGQRRVQDYQKTSKPNGLAILATCTNNGVRVAICDQYQDDYLDIVIEVMLNHRKYPFSKIPVSRNFKDWDKITKELLKL